MKNEINVKVGDKVKAVMPNGEIEYGVVIKRGDNRLWLDEGHENVHALDGGFLIGTTFEVIDQFPSDFEYCKTDLEKDEFVKF